MFLSILFGVVGERINNAFQSAATDPAFLAAMANPANQQAVAGMQGGGMDLNDTSFIEKLDPALARPFLDGFSSAIDTVFLVGGAVMLVAFALIWFLKEVPLSNKSGLQRQAGDGDADEQPVVVAMH